MEDHPYGWLSLLPPAVAIILAVVTRRAFVSLLVGVFCGALITTDWSIFQALYDTCEVHLWPSFTDPGKLRVFSFTLLMGAIIGVICRSGGMQGLIQLIAPLASSRRGGQLTTWFLGLLIFFDDYANTILLGNTLRPITDRLRISREKLAYLVDSTAAPVAGLSLLSTWVAVEIQFVADGIDTLGDGTGWTAIDLFLGSIPYRFYVLASLVLIPIIAVSGRDFGPMVAAEKKAAEHGNGGGDDAEDDELPEDVPARWYNAVLPIVVTLGVVMYLMYQTGLQEFQAMDEPIIDPSLRDILGKANSSLALQYGALIGLILAVVLALSQRLMTWPQVIDAAGKGAKIVLPAILILWCATSLSKMTGNKSVDGEIGKQGYPYKSHRLYTGDFLANKLLSGADDEESSGTLLKLFPTIVFLLAAVLSFATGTSFGTMGILLPMVVTFSYALLGEGAPPSHPILLAAVGGVLAGAVFGDHCSPISDTTILSSQSCGCNHVAHVITQLPYALLVGSVSVLLGTLPVAFGVSVWVLLPLQTVALLLAVACFGKKIETT